MKNLLITDKTNILYLSNFAGSSGFMLITKTKKYLFTDSRYTEQAKTIIKKDITLVDVTRVFRNAKELKENWQKILSKHRITQLGVEESNLTVARYKRFKKMSGSKVKFKNISGQIEKQRMIKEKDEIKKTIKSQRINEKVFLEIKKIIDKRKPVTEIELATKIKELGGKFGAEDVSFDPIVAFGAHSSRPHHSPGKRKLKKKDIVLIDMGMKYQGYCSDMTRMILPAKPTALETKIYNLVLEAQLAGIKGIKAGITGEKADALSRDIIDAAGYKEQYTHSGGHGIGLDIHESPALSKKDLSKFKENTIVTVEPGIYLPGKFGVRIEDMIIITKKGNKNLTKLPK
ncbi:aminopeptidase P family protein [Candidatus Gracilibacteria bacterium]|nr:aminopeptidase P family protein [Candidatus Gracilibacteria bacterium]